MTPKPKLAFLFCALLAATLAGAARTDIPGVTSITVLGRLDVMITALANPADTPYVEVNDADVALIDVDAAAPPLLGITQAPDAAAPSSPVIIKLQPTELADVAALSDPGRRVNIDVSGPFTVDSFSPSISGEGASIKCTGMTVKDFKLDMCGGLKRAHYSTRSRGYTEAAA
ncbi:hypothetical protein H632_c3487p0 [Helicosporidium sp. ATCC 50920]|nr:hypothetical protein H632_c3487p0 [Helicosporidium sp. ATCC 50920]|eukprot:KDD72343.1 hypothetical protein H632_c3487p0 [Helicosporidium sp. ATCC 50920]